jgi:hypothetical protein
MPTYNKLPTVLINLPLDKIENPFYYIAGGVFGVLPRKGHFAMDDQTHQPTLPPTPDQASPPRRPGAPPDNTNALKHGYYSRQARQARHAHPTSPDESPRTLQVEIDHLRLVIQRAAALAIAATNLTDVTRLLATLARATSNLDRLVRRQVEYLSDNPTRDAPFPPPPEHADRTITRLSNIEPPAPDRPPPDPH